MQPHRPPYPPSTAIPGGTPTKTLDDPITSIFLVLFVLGGATHITIFQLNMRRGKRFAVSAMLFGFCMARITTCTMRLVWSKHLTNIRIAIAAQIFVAAGVLLLFFINLIFAQRILRASHPHVAWAKWLSLAFKIYYASIAVMFIAVITCTVQSFYTLSRNTRRIDRDVQLVGATYFAVSAFVPIPLVLLGVVPSKKFPDVDNFGKGRFRTKIMIIFFSSCILTLGAAFRAGIAYVPRPRDDPAWYHSKTCFYMFNFGIEIIVVALYAIIRVDQRFLIPDGSRGPGDYSTGYCMDGKESKTSSLARILGEERVFGGESDVDGWSERGSGSDVEKGTEVLETGATPEIKPVPETERDSENPTGIVVSEVSDVDEAKPEPRPGHEVDGASEKEEKVVEAESSPVTKVEPEQGVDGASEKEEKAVEAKSSPATKVEPETGADGALEEKDSISVVEITSVLKSGPDRRTEGAGDVAAEVVPMLDSELEHEQGQPQGTDEAREK